jgi:flagellar protein FliT
MDQAQLLARYTEAWEMTRQMLEAARSEDWDGLLNLDQTRDQLFAGLMQAPPVAPENLQLADETATLIRNILAADQQIQSLSQAWMEEINGVLTSVNVEKKLLKAYDPV